MMSPKLNFKSKTDVLYFIPNVRIITKQIQSNSLNFLLIKITHLYGIVSFRKKWKETNFKS